MRKIVSDSLFTTIAFFFQRALGFIRELIIAGLLGPYYMGLRNTIIMLFNYSPYVYLGMDNEVYRKVAYLHEKDKEEANKTFSTVLYWSLISSVILALAIAIGAYISPYSDEFKIGLYILSPLVFLMIVGIIVNIYFSAIGRFKFNATVETINVVANSIFVVVLAYYFGFIGAILGLFLSILIRFVLYWHEISKYRIPIIFEWKRFVDTFKNGIKLFTASVAGTLYNQIDSLITILMLGPAALGIYGIATTINSLIYGTYGSTIIPVGQRMYKSAGEENKLKRYLDMLSGISAYLMVFPIAAIVLVTPFIIDTFIPKFHDAIAIVGILAVASFFNVTLNPISNYVVAKRKENVITISTLIAAAVNLVLCIYLIQQGYGIAGVAYATSISYLVNFILLMYLSKALEWHKVVEDLIPLAYLVLVLWAWTTNWTIILVSVFTLIYLPILLFVFQKRGILAYMLGVLQEFKVSALGMPGRVHKTVKEKAKAAHSKIFRRKSKK